MKAKTLFLAWQDSSRTRRWFPIGKLDVFPHPSQYKFSYTKGAQIAQSEVGFKALDDFPKFDQVYKSGELFPLFQNRIIAPTRPDFKEYLTHLDLAGTSPDPLEILAVGGGYRATDSFEVFPRLEKAPDDSFRCRFFYMVAVTSMIRPEIASKALSPTKSFMSHWN
ncbi:MAG: hypothetical protein IPP68_11920 [Elusimicrobia bacterium]|nr:hypothetical protein [Elusimicrobiota bacterium]